MKRNKKLQQKNFRLWNFFIYIDNSIDSYIYTIHDDRRSSLPGSKPNRTQPTLNTQRT